MLISNVFQAENIFFYLNFLPFSLTLYLPKEKKSDKRKEKEVSITFGHYLSLQIKKKNVIIGKFLISDNILSFLNMKISEIFDKLITLFFENYFISTFN